MPSFTRGPMLPGGNQPHVPRRRGRGRHGGAIRLTSRGIPISQEIAACVRGNGARYRHLEVDRLSWQLQQRRDPRPSFVGTFGVHPRDELFARVLAREHDEHKLRRQPRHEHAHQKLRGALRPAKSRFESQCCRPMRKGDGGRAERRAKSEHHDEPWPTQ